MSIQVVCPYCGIAFEKKENLLLCPGCYQTLLASDVSLTVVDAALRYMVLISGVGVFEKKGTVLAMMMDLMPGNPKDRRLIESAYLAAETEIGDFAKCVSGGNGNSSQTMGTASGKGKRRERKKDVLESVNKLVSALQRDFLQPDKIDTVVSALLGACDLEADVYLGSDHSLVYSRTFDLHMDSFVRAVSNVQKQKGVSAWKNGKDATAAFAAAAPRLKDEANLLSSVGKHAGGQFFALMKTISAPNFQAGDEKIHVARLRSDLKDAYLENGAIDFFLEGILKANKLEYTQSLGGTTGKGAVVTPKVPARPRKTPKTTTQNQNQNKGNAQTTGQQATKRQGTKQQATKQQGTNQQTTGQTTQGGSHTAVTKPKKKTKHPVLKWILLVVVLYLVFIYFILPFARRMNSRFNAWKTTTESQTADEEQTTTESQTTDEEQTTEDAEALSTDEVEEEDPYAAPTVSTSVAQSGVYKMNILYPSRYLSYQGPKERFSFSYPSVLYDSVDYSFENDGADIDITFQCSEGSSLFVSCHPYTSGGDLEQYKETVMNEELGALTNTEVLADRESMQTKLAGTQSSTSYTFYIKGLDASNSSLVCFVLYRISDENVMIMKMTYPQGSSTEDVAIRAYYAEVMYDLCGFGGDTDYPAWDDFKEDYGLE